MSQNDLTLDQLIRAIPNCWTLETRGNERYTGIHPAAGQCTASSLLIKRHCGGDIVRGIVGNTVHYWNSINGVWIDVTRAQFPRAWTTKRVSYNPSESLYIFEDTMERVNYMEWLVEKWLADN